jgi:hypothetical protein
MTQHHELADAPWWKRSLRMSAYVGVAFSPFVGVILLMLLIGGPEQQSKGTLWRMDLLALNYAIGAFVAGAIMGLFLRVARFLSVAILGGVLSFIPWVFGIAIASNYGYRDWTTTHTLISAVTAALLGAGFGFGVWKVRSRNRTRTPKVLDAAT